MHFIDGAAGNALKLAGPQEEGEGVECGGIGRDWAVQTPGGRVSVQVFLYLVGSGEPGMK